MFANQKSGQEIQTFLNRLLKFKIILKSRFLVFFLSCSSHETFYGRRRKEFNNSFFRNLVEKLTLPDPEIDEKDMNVLPQTNPLVDVMDELELREETQQDEVFKMHVFLEDLSTMAKQVKAPLQQAE